MPWRVIYDAAVQKRLIRCCFRHAAAMICHAATPCASTRVLMPDALFSLDMPAERLPFFDIVTLIFATQRSGAPLP